MSYQIKTNKQTNLKSFIMAKVKLFFGSELWVAISVFSMIVVALVGLTNGLLS